MPIIDVIREDFSSVGCRQSKTRSLKNRDWSHGPVAGTCSGKGLNAARRHQRCLSAQIFQLGIQRRCLKMPEDVFELMSTALWLSCIIISRNLAMSHSLVVMASTQAFVREVAELDRKLDVSLDGMVWCARM